MFSFREPIFRSTLVLGRALPPKPALRSLKNPPSPLAWGCQDHHGTHRGATASGQGSLAGRDQAPGFRPWTCGRPGRCLVKRIRMG